MQRQREHQDDVERETDRREDRRDPRAVQEPGMLAVIVCYDQGRRSSERRHAP